MTRRIRITDPEEANRIVEAAERLIRNGRVLTDNEEADYQFAKIFLKSFKKRKKKEEGR